MQALNPIIQRKLTTNICSSCLRRICKSSPSLRAARRLHTSRLLLSSTSQDQAQPLGDYYADLLAQPIPKSSASSSSSHALPTFVPSGDLTKEQRAARLFGTIQGSGYEHHTSPESTWKTINGVAVPPRPAEPDNCCMSGCVHCVWDDYRDDIEQWAGRMEGGAGEGKRARTGDDRKEKKSTKAYMSRPEVETASGSMDDDGGGSEALWDAPSTAGEAGVAEELFQGIPIGIREFMATEKRIRERKRGGGKVEIVGG